MKAAKRRSLRAAVAIGVVAWFAFIAAGCGDDSRSARTRRESDVYTAIVRSVAGQMPEQEGPPVVYVAPLADAKPFPLDVQVAVVEHLADDVTVRFVDDFAEAIAHDTDGKPVLDDGVLLRLGPVPASGTDVRVEGERYRTSTDGAAIEFAVRKTVDGWVAVPGVARSLPATSEPSG